LIESSEYIFHYTRDVNPYGKDCSDNQALENLVNIVVGEKITAFKNHSMFPELIDEIYNDKFNEVIRFSKNNNLSEDEIRDILRKEILDKDFFKSLFNVVSFTEIPFMFHDDLFRPNPYRQINLSPFGLAFRKKDVVVTNNYTCNSCFYVYEPNSESSNFMTDVFRDTIKKRISFRYDEVAHKPLSSRNAYVADVQKESNRLLVSLFTLVRGRKKEDKRRHDFAFEREWRNLDDFAFHISQVEFIIVREEFVELFKEKVSDKISIIYPDGDDEGLLYYIFGKILSYPIKVSEKISYPIELMDHNLVNLLKT